MVVASGQQVYEYSTAFGDEFNWRMPPDYPIIQPSSLLLEEAMYVIRAEYVRLVQQSSGYHGGGNAPQPESPGQGFFVKWVNKDCYGLFEPSSSGGHLAGRLPTVSGVGGCDPLMAGTLNAAYLTDMKNLFRATVAYITKVTSASPQEIMQHHLQGVKRYTDIYAQSGLFFQEFADWSYSNTVSIEEEPSDFSTLWNKSWGSDEYIDVFRQEQIHSGVWFTPRHLDELRIQPIPYINGTSGSAVVDNDTYGHNKEAATVHPVKPRYCRTDGTLGVGWGSRVNIFGNCLINAAVIQMSGGGNNDIVEMTSWEASSGTFSSHLPMSGSFTIPSMTSGWYVVVLGASGEAEGIGLASGLFPYGTAVDETTPTLNMWPRIKSTSDSAEKFDVDSEDIYVLSPQDNSTDVNTTQYGKSGFLVTDKMWAMQTHLTKQFSNNNRDVTESGLSWFRPHPVGADSSVFEMDFYDGSGEGGGRIWWGNEYEGIEVQASPVQYWHSNCYSYRRDNGTIVRGHASGSSTNLPGNGFPNGNQGVWITEWSLPLNTPTFNAVTSGSVAVGSDHYRIRPTNMTSITHDGTQFVCGGSVARASGDEMFTTQKQAYFVSDSTYTLTNLAWDFIHTGDVPDGDSQHSAIHEKPMVYHYHHGASEYLGCNSVDWSGKAIGGAYSGLYAVVSWDFTSPFVATSGEETRDWNTPTFGSGAVSEGLVSQIVDVPTIRINQFLQDEDDDQLYAYFQGEASGDTLNLNRRWIAKVDIAGGHPYELRETYQFGIEATAFNQTVNLNRCLFSNFMIGHNY